MTTATLAGSRRFDPVADTQAVFRVVLDAMARPGTRHTLPAADPNTPLAEAGPLVALAQTLLDHEVTFAVVPGRGDTALAAAERLAAYLTLVTRSRTVAAAAADYVIALGPLPAGLPTTLRVGQPAYPDESATLIALVPPSDDQAGAPVALTGPGVARGTVMTLPGLTPSDLASLAAANAEPPLGVDVILVDPAGTIVCLPRSTRLNLDNAPNPRTGLDMDSDTDPREGEPDGLHRG